MNDEIKFFFINNLCSHNNAVGRLFYTVFLLFKSVGAFLFGKFILK